MTETVVALLMFLNGSMIEFTYKGNMADCLKSKRIAEREVRPERVQFSCKKGKCHNRSLYGKKKNIKSA